MFDLGLRDWLLIAGPLIIAGVLVHGYWRMRRAAPKLKMALDREFLSSIGQSPDDDKETELSLVRAELPNGGARIVSRIVDRQESSSVAEKDLKLKDDVPVLMEPVSSEDEPDDDVVAQMEFESLMADEPLVAKRPEKQRKKPTAKSGKPERPKPPGPDKLIIMNIFSKTEPINGQHLLEALVTCGLQFGEMDIFHYRDAVTGKTLFSLVNAVEPGTFDLNTMDQLQTPAVSLFIKIHELDDPVSSFEQMIEVVKQLASELNADIRDGTHNSVTQQTLDHEMQLVREYSVKYK